MNRKILRLLATLTLAGAFVAGCAQPAATPAASTPAKSTTAPVQPTAATAAQPAQPAAGQPTAAAAAQPSKPAGNLVIAVPDLGTELWLTGQATSTMTHVSSLYDYLWYRDPTGKQLPGLAETTDLSPDGKTWTFHIRKGIKFHDGTDLTADDVKFSYELATNKDSVAGAMKALTAVVENVEVTDPNTVVFRLKQFSIDYQNQLSRDDLLMFAIASKKYVEKVGVQEAQRKPVGSGPYKFVEYVPKDHLTLQAVENHWRKTGQFATITLKYVPEEATRLAMLKAGQADIIDGSLDSLPDLKAGGFNLLSIPGGTAYIVGLGGQYQPNVPTFDSKVPWAGDPRDPASMDRALKVRKALNLAVNRDEIVKTIFQGQAKPMPMILADPIAPFDASMKPYPFDVPAAKKLLEEAGYPKGFDMTVQLVSQTGRPEQPEIGKAVAMMWQQNLGLNVKQVNIDFNSFRPGLTARKMAGITWPYGTFSSRAEPSAYWLVMGSTAATSPLFGFQSDEFDAMIAKANAEPDVAKRHAMDKQLAEYVYTNYLLVPIASADKIYATSKKVGSWPMLYSGQMSNFEGITYGPGFKP